MSKGKFIVIDGIGGCGKTTHAKLLRARMEKDTVLTHEPGGTPIAEKIRKLLLHGLIPTADVATEFFLFWTARAEHMREKIIPALRAGRNVISDRFDSSTFAFQIFGEKHPELTKLFWEARKVVLGSYKPYAYIILDIPVLAAEKRRAGRKPTKDRFDEKSRAYQGRVRIGFKEFAKAIGQRAHVVDANSTAREVDKNIWAIVRNVLH
ncbi:MAG: Thymidylate kinase [Candidatus Kaiserbacteria bacterium GW2011_GWA2_49_19]|uniref:Thymidylate kinase n=2 Tax=Candidatus Kaiseribacteriota TaxID=1752734 RepID=A0A0G1VSX7_9BACT|nr:MAG: Thymidylate kinase [Candidatus Kaiserbacteria bacterium GW2011_GWA2_49_19]OGG60727.1 MAG: dTMP kinase [Candidatus Kaiserbacteria bacterium RIFCSPHIGHO2_02_FULL_49_16]